jgi:mannosyl-oligosaccharide alpha-1,2-mannosidase
MALIKRYGVYMALAAFFLYTLYSLSFPYQPEGAPAQPGKGNGNKPNDNKKGKPPKAAAPPKQYNWAQIPVKHPVESMVALPTGKPTPLPKIQHTFKEEEANAKNIRETRREEVKKAFEICWRNYRQKAWMRDELKPITGGSVDTFGGWAASLIDALDTLWIMGFKEEFMSALKDVEKVNFGSTPLEKVNIFGTAPNNHPLLQHELIKNVCRNEHSPSRRPPRSLRTQ